MPNADFNYKWNNHEATLISVFTEMLDKCSLVDCTLTAEGKHIGAHKIILSACSPYFESLLQHTSDKHPIFILKDIKFCDLEALMLYIYTGQISIPETEVHSFLELASTMQIKGLVDGQRTTIGAEQVLEVIEVVEEEAQSEEEVMYIDDAETETEEQAKIEVEETEVTTVDDSNEDAMNVNDSSSPKTLDGLNVLVPMGTNYVDYSTDSSNGGDQQGKKLYKDVNCGDSRPNEKNYKCATCTRWFKYKRNFKKHTSKNECYVTPLYDCRDCEYTTAPKCRFRTKKHRQVN